MLPERLLKLYCRLCKKELRANLKENKDAMYVKDENGRWATEWECSACWRNNTKEKSSSDGIVKSGGYEGDIHGTGTDSVDE